MAAQDTRGETPRSSWRQIVALMLGAVLLLPTLPDMGTAAPSSRDGTKVGVRRTVRELASVARLRTAATGKKKWLVGPLSRTYEIDPFGIRHVSTMEAVAYKGKKNGSFPRVGKVYRVSIWVGRPGDDSAGTGVVTEMKLPYKTKLAIKHSVKKRRVRCYKGRLNRGYRQLKGRKCPNRPIRGVHGWRFVPRGGVWKVPRKYWIEVTFPVRSKRRLRGIFDRRNGCIVGSVQNLSGWAIRDWDAPRPGERCPLKDGHGAYQGVFVAGRRR